MTQPAVSQTIGKLRIYFNDQLFIRTGRGTRPTERATAMLEAVEEVLQIIRERIDSCAVFDPAISDRVFTFISTDFGAAVFLPALTAELQRSAPGVRVRPVAANTQTMKAQLESGEVDLAVGGFNDLIAGFHVRRLYVDSFVCLAGTRFNVPAGQLSRSQFQAASHVIVTPLPPGYERVERVVREQVPATRILLEVPSFLSLLVLLRESDLLCIVPKRVGSAMARMAGLSVYPVPFAIPKLEVSQFWHARVHNDPAHRWFRSVFDDLFGHRPRASK